MQFIHLNEIMDLCQVEAVANRLAPSTVSRWRRMCRDYSKAFSTPYDQVLQMDPEFVFLAVYEEQLDDIDPIERLDDLMDRVYTIEDPNYEKSKEIELQEFIADAEEEEQERIKAGKPVFQKKKKTVSKKEESPPPKLPTSGGVNLSYLQKMDQEE